MKKWIGILALAGGLLLSGCASLLERSYSVVEPYADRYWDASAEDTLRAESYQDLVNSLLLLVEERSEEGVIRYYTEGNAYSLALQATWEVREDTMLGSYLLEDLSFRYETGEEGVCTLTYELIYREDAEDVDSLMVLSDSQSLVDLLRLAIREGHDRLTARFAYDMPREDVEAAVAAMWREVCLGSAEEPLPPETAAGEETDLAQPPESGAPTGGEIPPEESGTPEESPQETSPGEAPAPEEPAAAARPELSQEGSPQETSAQEETVPEGTGDGPGGETQPVSGEAPGAEEETPPVPEIPPCPWELRYYPDQDAAELVEVLLLP